MKTKEEFLREAREFKIQQLAQALLQTKGRQAKAAQLLGLNRNTFHRYLKELDMDAKEFKVVQKEKSHGQD